MLIQNATPVPFETAKGAHAISSRGEVIKDCCPAYYRIIGYLDCSGLSGRGGVAAGDLLAKLVVFSV